MYYRVSSPRGELKSQRPYFLTGVEGISRINRVLDDVFGGIVEFSDREDMDVAPGDIAREIMGEVLGGFVPWRGERSGHVEDGTLIS
jgi:hypothetical protein